MNIEPGSQALAQEGLRQIETAVLRLLDANPPGLRNAQIADALGLRSNFMGRQKDYLTYSVLGKLLTEGTVGWNNETKLFTALHPDRGPQETAQAGLQQVEDAILRLLETHPQGLRNTEVAELLDLRSDFRGRQRDYLTYSVLGGLIARNQVAWDQQTKIFTKLG